MNDSPSPLRAPMPRTRPTGPLRRTVVRRARPAGPSARLAAAAAAATVTAALTTLAGLAAPVAQAAPAGQTAQAGQAAQDVGIPRTIDRLTVAYDDGSGNVRTYDVTCGLRNRSEACSHLDSLGGPIPAVARGQMCSMLYGGPQTARVTGLWHGHPVDETYRRTNGCEVARWGRMEPTLPDPRADQHGQDGQGPGAGSGATAGPGTSAAPGTSTGPGTSAGAGPVHAPHGQDTPHGQDAPVSQGTPPSPHGHGTPDHQGTPLVG